MIRLDFSSEVWRSKHAYRVAILIKRLRTRKEDFTFVIHPSDDKKSVQWKRENNVYREDGPFVWGGKIFWLYLCKGLRLSQRESCCPVRWDCRIHRLYFYRGVRLPQKVPWIYDTKQSDIDVSVMLEFWEIRNTPLLLSFPGPHLPRELAPDRVLSMGRTEVNCVITLNWIVWN